MGAPGFFSVQLHLLEACNLECAHCYNANPPPTQAPPTEEILRRLDAIYAFCERRAFPVPDVHLSGGEPTLRKDLVRIVEHVMSYKEEGALLFTNGTRFSPELAAALHRAGLRHVQVSLEGPEELTDAVRGAGVHRAAMDTLSRLSDAGFRLTVSVTVTSRNVDALPAFVASLDARAFHFHLREVLPTGAGASQGGLDRDARRRFSEWAVGYRGRSTVGVEDPVHCSVAPRYARSLEGCVAGRNHLCVDVSGAVYPCRPLSHRVGHVDDLDAAWDSPDMRRLRARDFGGACGLCDLRAHCGGCRVHPHARGDLFGEDTRCFAREGDLVRTPREARAIALAARLGRAWYELRHPR